jgi:hypothetical protein
VRNCVCLVCVGSRELYLGLIGSGPGFKIRSAARDEWVLEGCRWGRLSMPSTARGGVGTGGSWALWHCARAGVGCMGCGRVWVLWVAGVGCGVGCVLCAWG